MIKWSLDSQGNDDISTNFSFVTAIISGYLHSYHYARNFSISLIADSYPELAHSFISLTKIEDSPVDSFPDPGNGFFSFNYAGSGIAKNPKKILSFVERNDVELTEKYHSNEINAIKDCLNYCIDKNLYFLEATDVVVPLGGTNYSDSDNLKAYFLKSNK